MLQFSPSANDWTFLSNRTMLLIGQILWLTRLTYGAGCWAGNSDIGLLPSRNLWCMAGERIAEMSLLITCTMDSLHDGTNVNVLWWPLTDQDQWGHAFEHKSRGFWWGFSLQQCVRCKVNWDRLRQDIYDFSTYPQSWSPLEKKTEKFLRTPKLSI